MKKFFVIAGCILFIIACSNADKKESSSATDNKESAGQSADAKKAELDAKRGIGKFTNVEVSPTLDQTMAAAGTTVYDVKCASCHKLSDERLVGPGWKDVTKRRTAEWIMNFTTNPDEMLDKDAEAQAMLEICMVRMPNQSLTDADARHVFEFMRKNDGVK